MHGDADINGIVEQFVEHALVDQLAVLVASVFCDELPGYLVDQHDVDLAGLDIGEHSLQGRAIEGASRESAIAVLRGLQDALAPKAALDVFSLHGLPLYNEDDNGEHAPESVRALRSAIETSDGVIVVSPETITACPAS